MDFWNNLYGPGIQRALRHSLYFIKFVLEMGDAGGQLFQSLKSIGWLVKPLWGFISDRFPILGYRRRSWFILMATLGFIFWMFNALMAFLEIHIPVVYLIGFNLAFSTYAFVDVVSDAIMVEQGRRLRRVASFINCRTLPAGLQVKILNR